MLKVKGQTDRRTDGQSESSMPPHSNGKPRQSMKVYDLLWMAVLYDSK